jgi:hypothetical protein
MSTRSPATTHSDVGAPKFIAYRLPGNAQLRTDLAQHPTLGVQVGCTLNVARSTVRNLSTSFGSFRFCVGVR